MDNSLAAVHLELVEEWPDKNKGLELSMVSLSFHKKVILKCKHGCEWESTIESRTKNERGCPFCSHSLILAGHNDLQTVFLSVAEEWSHRNLPLTPDMVDEKSRKNIWSKCHTCGYTWEYLIKSRIQCTVHPVCADRAVMNGYAQLTKEVIADGRQKGQLYASDARWAVLYTGATG